MNLEEIKQYLEQNKDNEEVKQFVEGLQQDKPVDVQRIEQLSQEDESIKSWLDSQKDKHTSKSLETWKTNNLDKIVAEKLKELNPDKSPEQLELEQIKQQLADMENQKTRESLKNKALTVATEKDIPTSVIDFLIGQDEDSTVENLSTFETAMKSYVDNQVKARINDSSYTPPASDDNNKKTFTVEEIREMSEQEITENWDAVQDTLSQK